MAQQVNSNDAVRQTASFITCRSIECAVSYLSNMLVVFVVLESTKQARAFLLRLVSHRGSCSDQTKHGNGGLHLLHASLATQTTGVRRNVTVLSAVRVLIIHATSRGKAVSLRGVPKMCVRLCGLRIGESCRFARTLRRRRDFFRVLSWFWWFKADFGVSPVD